MEGSGVRGQGSGVRSQGSGVRGQESGVRGQVSGVRGRGYSLLAEPSGQQLALLHLFVTSFSSASEAAMHRICYLVAGLALARVVIAQETEKPLTPAEAAKQIDKQVTVEMAVRSTGGNRNKYLNSASDYSSASNFTLYIPEAAVKKFAEAKIDKPEEYYYGK